MELLRNVYKKLGNYQQALENQEQYSHLRDSLFNAETVKKVSGVELKYALEKQKEVYEANAQKQESEKEKNRLAFYAAGGILLLLLALAALFLYLQKTKLKNAKLSNDKLELERKNLSLEKEKLTEDLDFQHREMASKVMYILKKNELIKSISDQLSTLKATTPPPNQKQLQEIIQEMNQKKDQDVWTEFETHFTKVHPNFYEKLSQQFPNPTPNEKKMCAFLRLNMSTKDISAITYQSVNSISVSRSRFRRKLNIQGEVKNLINFLSELNEICPN